jgi:hypothetical protein
MDSNTPKTSRQRLQDLHILRETMQRNNCFDTEDIAWVDEEIHALETKLSVKPEKEVLPPFLTKEMTRHRATVLSALDDTTKCLSGSKLGRRLAEKQRRMEGQM